MPHPHTLVTLSLPALLALPLAPLARAETPAEATRAAARTITDARCGAHVEFLASDLLEGRATPSRGLDLAAEYVRSHFARLNLEPGGEKGAWFQGFPVLKEIRLGLQECGRRVAMFIRKRRREADEAKKRSYIEKYIPQVAIGLQQILELSDVQRDDVVRKLGDVLERSRKA